MKHLYLIPLTYQGQIKVNSKAVSLIPLPGWSVIDLMAGYFFMLRGLNN